MLHGMEKDLFAGSLSGIIQPVSVRGPILTQASVPVFHFMLPAICQPGMKSDLTPQQIKTIFSEVQEQSSQQETCQLQSFIPKTQLMPHWRQDQRLNPSTPFIP